MRRPLLFLAAVLVFGVYFISVREGTGLFERLFSPPAFRVILEEKEESSGTSETENVRLTGRVRFSESGEDCHIFLLVTETSGTVRCRAAGGLRCPLPGETVSVRGTASLFSEAVNPGMFDARKYYDAMEVWLQLETDEITVLKSSKARLPVLLHRFREKASAVIRASADPDDVSVFLTLFCGDKSELTDGEREAGDYGLSFLISFSGLHVTMIIGAVCRVLRRFTDKWHAAGAAFALAVCVYLLTGRSPSVFRGAVIAVCRAAAPLVKRKFDYVSAGALSLILLILDLPGIIFVSTFAYMLASLLAVGLFCPALREVLPSKRRAVSALLFLLSLQCFLLPVRLFSSFSFVLLSPLISASAMLIFPLLLFSVYSGTLLGFFSSRAAYLLYFPGHGVLKVFRLASELLQTGTLTRVTGCPGRVWLLSYYSFLALLYIALRIFTARNRSLPEKEEMTAKPVHYVLAVFLLLGLIVSALIFDVNSSDEKALLALSVGQGDCNVILLGDHRAVVIDCGSTGIQELYLKRIRPTLRYFGVREIPAVFISHPDTDHISGLEALFSDYYVENLFYSAGTEGNEKLEAVLSLPAAENTCCRPLSSGMCVDFRESGSFAVLWPDGDCDASSGSGSNDCSLVLLYETEGLSALYTGDISSETEAKLRLPGNIDYLKVAHHGSKYSTSAEFLAELRPRIATVSCSRNNTYGHPAPETLERLREAGTEVHLLFREGAFILRP